ncbi:uncharacterized protein TNCV_4626231 [Trichonephila clavipes]|nr:uncharacterized protein TNCV_4626231 [Trichonephila clavipes]
MMTNVEFETVTTIVPGLKPVKIGLVKLCCQNATFLTAEGVFSFVIGELNERNSEFVKNMKYSLIQGIKERRNVNLIEIMQYLNFGRKYEAAAVTVVRYFAIINRGAAMLNGPLHSNDYEGRRMTCCIEMLPTISHSALDTCIVAKS